MDILNSSDLLICNFDTRRRPLIHSSGEIRYNSISRIGQIWFFYLLQPNHRQYFVSSVVAVIGLLQFSPRIHPHNARHPGTRQRWDMYIHMKWRSMKIACRSYLHEVNYGTSSVVKCECVREDNNNEEQSTSVVGHDCNMSNMMSGNYCVVKNFWSQQIVPIVYFVNEYLVQSSNLS